MMRNILKIKSIIFSAIMGMTLIHSQSFAAPEIVTYCGPADCGLSQGIETQIEPSCRSLSPAGNYYKNGEEINGATIWCMDFYVNDINNIPQQCGWPYNHSELVNGSYMRCTAQGLNSVSQWTPQINNTPVDGVCGSANGQVLSVIPSTNLCASGTPTVVVGEGPWTWSCNGSNGNNISCRADKAITIGNNAQCGPIHATEIDHTPLQNELCSAGTPSVLSGSGPWSWSCSSNQSGGGLTSSQIANCWANKKCTDIITEIPIMCDINDPSLAGVCYTPTISTATFIVTNNKVGINTMDPEYNLDVNGTIRAAQILTLSDERVKKHIEKIENALEKIRVINGYEFTWKKDGNPDMGVLAQEIEKVFAEAVRTDTNGIKTVQYNSLIAPIIQAINELNNMIDIQLEKANKQANDITILEQKVK